MLWRGRTQIYDWNRIATNIETLDWAGDLHSGIFNDLDRWIRTYADEPGRVAGWFHDYNCQECAGRLEFDLEQPNEHRCPSCGRINTGDKVDKAWNNTYRGRANSQVLNAGFAHNITPDARYLDYIRTVLSFYADNYEAFTCEPPAKRFEGKLMNQHLDYLYEQLFRPEAEMFDFFADRIYNIPVWIKCAQAMIGAFFGKDEHIQRGFRGKYGILDQLDRGVTGEGMWYEGSMHYHFYALQPLCYLLLICRRYELDIPEMSRICGTVERMFEYPLRMLFRNRRFPNPNDGHPMCDIDRYTVQYEYASVIFENPLFREVCGTFHRGKRGSGSLSRLLFNSWPETEILPDHGSVNNPNSHPAMLKTDNTEVFLKYGAHTHLHLHPDIMNLEIAFDRELVSYDLGNAGYASFLFAEWQRKTAAHNTVVADMRDHRSFTEGIVEEFDPEAALLQVRAKGVYEALHFVRRVQAGDLEVRDRFEVIAGGSGPWIGSSTAWVRSGVPMGPRR